MGVQISGDTGNVLATKGTYTGNLTVGGVLTYEDVTNVDSIGIVTARAGVLVGSGITLSKDGDIFATGVTTSTTFVGDLTGTASQVTIANGSNDRVITAASANTLNGEANFTYDSSNVARLVKASAGAAKTTVPLILDNNAAGGDGTNPDVVAIGFAAAGTTKASIRADVYGEGNLTFHNNNDSEKLRITSGGNMGLNVTPNSTRAPLHVHRVSSSDVNIHMTNTDTGITENDGMTVFANSQHGGLWLRENSPMYFATNDTERVRIQASGGISFNGDSSADNALDDYEEGNHTPSYNALSTGSVSNNFFKYVKVGGLVHFQGYQSFQSTNDSDVIQMSVPFTNSGSNSWCPFTAQTNLSGFTNGIVGRIKENSNTAEFKYMSGDGHLTYSNLNGGWLIFAGTFKTTE